jgi:hypothetical protein
MATSSCAYLVLIKSDGRVAKLHVDAGTKAAIDKLDEMLAAIEPHSPQLLTNEPYKLPPPVTKTPLISRALGELLAEAAQNAAQAVRFRQPFASLINEALLAAKNPKLKKALREALARVTAGRYLTTPSKADIERIARLLDDKQKWRLLGLYGTARHQATFDLIRKSLAEGYELLTDKPLRTLISEARNAETATRLKPFKSMTVEQYVKKVFSKAVPGSAGAKQDAAFIEAFGKAGKKGARRDVLLLDLKPDIAVMNAKGELEAVYDLTSLPERTLQQAATLVVEDLRITEEWGKRLKNLSSEEAVNVVLADPDIVAQAVLSKSKELHAMRTAVVQDLLGKVGVAGPGSGGEFFYEALFPWGKPDL